jgi:hypothetical protein
MKKLILILTLLSFYPRAQAQIQPYQCQIFSIPRGQMPYTDCYYQVYLNLNVNPNTFWSSQRSFGPNSILNACETARRWAWQNCQQTNYSWYGGRGLCFNQYYQCQTYIPVL